MTYSDPFAASRFRSKAATGPEPLPNTASSPRGLRQSSDPMKVSLPTESYTTGTFWPPVISFTRWAKFSRVYTMV